MYVIYNNLHFILIGAETRQARRCRFEPGRRLTKFSWCLLIEINTFNNLHLYSMSMNGLKQFQLKICISFAWKGIWTIRSYNWQSHQSIAITLMKVAYMLYYHIFKVIPTCEKLLRRNNWLTKYYDWKI